MTGYTNQALAYYNRGKVAMENGQHVATLDQVDTFAIDFGRFQYDPLLAFDPQRFTNPQLKITWDENGADLNCSVNYLEIWAELFDEKVINPIGFLSGREIWSSAFGVSDAYSEVGLPEDEVIRQILVRGYRDGYTPLSQFDEVRLDENMSERIPFDYTDLGKYVDRMKAHWPMMEVPIIFETGTAGRLYYFPATDGRAFVLALAGNDAGYPYLETASAFAAGGKATLYGSLTYIQYIGMSKGWMPWHCIQFPMGKQDDIDDWFDPAGKKPRFRIRAAGSGEDGTGTVVIETLHKY